MENETMNQDDVLFLEVLAEYLKNEMDAILKMIELYRRSLPIEDHYYFNKKFLLSSIINNCATEHNAQILNEMKSKFVSLHFLNISFLSNNQSSFFFK